MLERQTRGIVPIAGKYVDEGGQDWERSQKAVFWVASGSHHLQNQWGGERFCKSVYKIKISFFFHYLSDNEAIWDPNASSSEILTVAVISTLITYTHCSLTVHFRTVSILLILKETTCLGHCCFERQFAQIPVFTKKLESELCYYKLRVTNDWILLRVYQDINLDTAYLLLGTVFRLQGKVPPLKTFAVNCGNWFGTDRTS